MTFLSVNTSVFSGNQAVIGPFGGGGALYSSGGVLSLGNNTFIGNAANGYGGAIAYSYECTAGKRLCVSPHICHMVSAMVMCLVLQYHLISVYVRCTAVSTMRVQGCHDTYTVHVYTTLSIYKKVL